MALDLQLPLNVVGPSDVSRLRRDLTAYDDALHQASLRAKAGTKTEVNHPGKIFSELATLNKLDLSKSPDRQALQAGLQAVLEAAPVITMSFASDPSAAFIMKLVSWLRTNIHPTLLVRTGLQPSIAAGCTLRTGSRVYDFSLRSKFTEQRPLLVQKLQDIAASTPPLAAQGPA